LCPKPLLHQSVNLAAARSQFLVGAGNPCQHQFFMILLYNAFLEHPAAKIAAIEPVPKGFRQSSK
jgi:hypothetical protein